MSNQLILSEEMARIKAERAMQQLAQKLGIPPGLPQAYYVIPIRKDGRIVDYSGKWGKHGLLWIANQIGNIVHIECRNMLRSKQNNGLATAYCKIVYEDGRTSIEEGEADITEKNIQSNPGGPYKQADNMARVRALEHAIINITANGSLLSQETRIDKPVVYEVINENRED